MPRSLAALFIMLTAALACVLEPGQALAWGPGVHMVTGNWVLQNLAALPAAVAGALMQHPGQFLHGTLSADIFIGKGSKAKKGHSHNWESGFTLLDKADDARSLAYAYGYLAHLAADTVAHNVFVPGLFHTAPGSGRLAHMYLEIQADRLVAWDSGDALGVFYEKDSPLAASMLQQAMRQKNLPFWLKTHIFQGGIAVGGTRLWRCSMRMVDALMPGRERGNLLDRMLVLSTRAIVNLLQLSHSSPLLALDPIGADALLLAQKQGSGKTRPGPATRKRDAAAACSRTELHVTVPSVLETFPPVCSTDGSIAP